MYGKVLSAATVPAAIVLPNTGSNRVLAVATTITLVVGVAAAITTVVRYIASKSV